MPKKSYLKKILIIGSGPIVDVYKRQGWDFSVP